MLDLAVHYGKGPVLLRDLSGRQEISIKYLEQLAPLLRTGGLVKSTRGPHGGYHLAMPPSEITMYDIIRTLEGSASLTDCVEDSDACHRSNACATHEVWEEVTHKIVEALSGITLEEMTQRQRKLEDARSMVYHI